MNYWIQVCLIFSQVTFAGAWAALFISAVDLNKLLVIGFNLVATGILVITGWYPEKHVKPRKR